MLEKGKNPSLHDNMIIHGDNLTALKALLPTHGGKVNCIYIDPPYNTGNEGWVYNDNVNNAMMRQWFGKVVDSEDMTRHDKWLCMMWPRLSLLRELLAEDGVIFVSIDDNEQHRLRMVMDEVFGEDNFVAGFVVIRAEGGGMAKQAIKGHDHLLVYAKNISLSTPLKRPRDVRGEIVTKDGIEYWLEEDWLRKEFGKYGTCHYEEIVKYKGKEKKKEIDQLIASGDCVLIEKKNGLHVVARMRNLSMDSSKFYSVLKHLSANGIKDLDSVNLKGKFDYPKPISLLMELIRGKTMHTKDQSDIILDSFAGSGTTAHAVLALNKEDGGNRKFILVECEDYADKITAERVRRVIKGVTKSKDENLKEGLGGNFGYWELGGPMEMQSILEGDNLPTYNELARYVFYTATGEQWSQKLMKKRAFFVGESEHYQVYLFYKPDVDYLTETSLTLELAESLPKPGKKWRLVFAPTRYANPDILAKMKIKFSQLPFEIYKVIE